MSEVKCVIVLNLIQKRCIPEVCFFVLIDELIQGFIGLDVVGLRLFGLNVRPNAPFIHHFFDLMLQFRGVVAEVFK